MLSFDINLNWLFGDCFFSIQIVGKFCSGIYGIHVRNISGIDVQQKPIMRIAWQMIEIHFAKKATSSIPVTKTMYWMFTLLHRFYESRSILIKNVEYFIAAMNRKKENTPRIFGMIKIISDNLSSWADWKLFLRLRMMILKKRAQLVEFPTWKCTGDTQSTAELLIEFEIACSKWN